MRILMILAAESRESSRRSLSLDQVIEAHCLLQDSGAEVVIASSQGGDPPIRGKRERSRQLTLPTQRFQGDRSARDAISDTLKLEQIYPEEFDAVICMGVLELAAPSADTETTHSLLDALIAAGKPVAIVPSELEFVPRGSFEDLLIAGSEIRAPSLAAKAILAALAMPAVETPSQK
jgi:hypothetical protein